MDVVGLLLSGLLLLLALVLVLALLVAPVLLLVWFLRSSGSLRVGRR